MNNKVQKKAINMTEGNAFNIILRFSLPLLLGNLFQQLYNTVDSIIVGNFVGKHALAAVGAGFPFMTLMISFFFGFSVATTVMISQAYGSGNHAKIPKIANSVYKAVLIASIPFTIICYLLAGWMLEIIQVPDDGTLAMGTIYLQIVFLGLIGTIGFNLNSGLLQGVGDSSSSVRFLILACIINIILDLFFVIFLKMGVAGAALATSISQWASFLLGLVHIQKNYPEISFRPLQVKFDQDIFKESLRLGLPSALQGSIFSLGAMAYSRIINNYGTNFIAGFQAAMKIDNFIFMPLDSYSAALTSYTGQNAGARRIDRIKEGRKAGLKIAFITCLIVCIVLYPLSDFVMRLFSQESEVIQVGVWYLHSLLPFYFTLAFLFIFNGVLRGVGQMNVPMISSFISLWLARVPTAYIISKTLGKRFIFYAMPFGWLMGSIISIIYYAKGNWKKKLLEKVDDDEQDFEIIS